MEVQCLQRQPLPLQLAPLVLQAQLVPVVLLVRQVRVPLLARQAVAVLPQQHQARRARVPPVRLLRLPVRVVALAQLVPVLVRVQRQARLVLRQLVVLGLPVLRAVLVPPLPQVVHGQQALLVLARLLPRHRLVPLPQQLVLVNQRQQRVLRLQPQVVVLRAPQLLSR